MSLNVATSPADIRRAIRTCLREGPISIAVPFWGRGALKELQLDGRNAEGARILCNLSVGGCNPAVIRELLDSGYNVRALASLHAKVYIGATRAVLGSANASADGLGLGRDGEGWNEACVTIRDSAELGSLCDWFNELWEEGSDMSNHMIASLLLEQAEAQLARDQVDGLDLLDAVRARPDEFNDVMITLDHTDYDGDVDNLVEKMRFELGRDIDAWQDWPQIPAGTEIVSFYIDKSNGSLSYEGMYSTPENIKAATDPETNATIVTSLRRIQGTYEVSAKSKRSWFGFVKKWIKDIGDLKKAEDGAFVMRLSEFSIRYVR